jgi:hypothetical protein
MKIDNFLKLQTEDIGIQTLVGTQNYSFINI